LFKLVDFDVVMSAKKGNENAIMEILKHYRKFIDYECAKIHSNYGNTHERYEDEDCKQYVFLKILKAIKDFDPNHRK